MTLKLYGLPGACSMAPHIILEQLGLDYELVLVDRDKLLSPEHLAVNPMGQAPSLATDGELISESTAIMLHLTEKYGEGKIAPPPGSIDRARMMMMMFMASQEHPAFGLWLRPFRFHDDEDIQKDLVETANQRFAQCFDRLDGWLEGRDWLIGDSLTPADALAFVHARWGLRVAKPTTEYPNIWRFAEHMAEQPAVRRVMEQEGIDLNVEQYGGPKK